MDAASRVLVWYRSHVQLLPVEPTEFLRRGASPSVNIGSQLTLSHLPAVRMQPIDLKSALGVRSVLS